MRKVFLLLVLFFAVSGVFAQRSRVVKNLPNYDNRVWHFGFTLGGNNMGFKVDKCDGFFEGRSIYGIEAGKHTGFHIGPVSNLHLGRFVDFRMLFDLSFNQRDLIFYYVSVDKSEKRSMQQETVALTSTMLEFPVHFKFKAERWGNFAPYIIAGGSYKYDLSAGKKQKNSDELKIKLLKHDPCAEWGGGFDFYLQYFKFSVELKYSVGLLNTLDKTAHTEYSNNINKLTSNALILSLHFE
jgi:hypothetical protein